MKKNIWKILVDNKEWLFSGIGAVAFSLIISPPFCTSSERAGSIDFSSSTNNVEGSINNATGDNVAGDKIAGDKIVNNIQEPPSYRDAT